MPQHKDVAAVAASEAAAALAVPRTEAAAVQAAATESETMEQVELELATAESIAMDSAEIMEIEAEMAHDEAVAIELTVDTAGSMSTPATSVPAPTVATDLMQWHWQDQQVEVRLAAQVAAAAEESAATAEMAVATEEVMAEAKRAAAASQAVMETNTEMALDEAAVRVAEPATIAVEATAAEKMVTLAAPASGGTSASASRTDEGTGRPTMDPVAEVDPAPVSVLVPAASVIVCPAARPGEADVSSDSDRKDLGRSLGKIADPALADDTAKQTLQSRHCRMQRK